MNNKLFYVMVAFLLLISYLSLIVVYYYDSAFLFHLESSIALRIYIKKLD